MSIENGTYRARATGADGVQFGRASTGNEQIAITFALLDENDRPTEQQITWLGYFTDGTMERTLESIEICGWDMSTGTGECHHVADQIVLLVIESEEYNGKTYAKVKCINRVGGAGFRFAEVLDTRSVSGLMGRIRAHKATSGAVAPVAASRSAQPQRGAPARPQAQPKRPIPPSDDDIPF